MPFSYAALGWVAIARVVGPVIRVARHRAVVDSPPCGDEQVRRLMLSVFGYCLTKLRNFTKNSTVGPFNLLENAK